jgi:hypothetical protein
MQGRHIYTDLMIGGTDEALTETTESKQTND